MVFPQRAPDASFACPQGIDSQCHQAGAGQGRAAGLEHRVLFGPLPVAMDIEHGGIFAWFLGKVQQTRHANAWEGLKGDFFNTETIGLDGALDLGGQVRCEGRIKAEGEAQLFTEGFGGERGSLAHFGGLGPDPVQVGVW